MRSLIFALAMTMSVTAQAACFGSGAFQTCNDSSGNSYTVNRLGNMTTMQCYIARTGSSWSQNSTTLGNSTYTNGQTNGHSWNMQQNNFGNIQTYSGTNSRGQSFYHTCAFGKCN
jgi:hypothetical protein